MEALLRSNREQTVGYGKDGYCESARELIKRRPAVETAQVYFYSRRDTDQPACDFIPFKAL